MSKSAPITSQQWSQVQRLLDELDLLPKAERRQALASREIADPRVREEAESLIDAEEAGGDFLQDSPWLDTQPRAVGPSLEPGTVLGAFRVEELIGRGGMAEVYRARRIAEFDQVVAIKLLSGDAATRLDAFQRERRILAVLEHPGISRIVDGGVTEAGRPFMVMEYVEGTDLVRHATERKLDLAARLELFRQVCDAVSFAHRHLIIHRDLKPGNIRVSPEGQVKLLDFGVAKLLQPEARTQDFETATILTPEFAAPEQLYGHTVTTATDVYALGAVLFHLLSGAPPFQTEGQAMHLVIDQMLRSEMPPLSTTAEKRGNPPIPPKLLRGDLDAIVARATRKKPADRYATVNELWEDIARHRAHRPVEARRGSTAYELGRMLRRYRVAVTAGAAITVVLIAGVVSTLWQARAALHAEREAVAQAARAERTKEFFVSMFASASALHRTGDGPLTVDAALEDALKRIDTELADEPRFQADLLNDFGEIRTGQGDLPGAKDMFVRALALHEKLLAPDDPVLADTLLNRGAIDSFIGESPAGIAFTRRGVSILERHPERAHELLLARFNLAVQETNLGNYELALEQFLPVVEASRTDTPEAQALLPNALMGASNAYYGLNRFEPADAAAAEALRLYESRLGPKSAYLVGPLRVLAESAARRNDAVAERALRERAVAVVMHNFPNGGNPDVGATLVDLGSMELRAGNVVAGDARLREAIRLSARGGEDWYVLRAYMRLGSSELKQDRPRDAVATLEPGAAACMKDHLKDERVLCASLRVFLARARLAAGDVPAETLRASMQSETDGLQQFRRDKGKASGVTDIDIAEMQIGLAEALSALKRHADAAETYREVVVAFRGLTDGIGADNEGARWRYVIELVRTGDEQALAEAEAFLKAETASPGSDTARREIAMATLEQARGRRELASVHVQSALRTLLPLGAVAARTRAQATELAASLR